MSGDLISRSALLEEYEWLKSVVNPCSVAEVEEHIERIRRAPAVEAEPVVHAHWVPDEGCGSPYGVLVISSCSNCGGRVSHHGYDCQDKHCRYCGAHMDEEVDE